MTRPRAWTGASRRQERLSQAIEDFSPGSRIRSGTKSPRPDQPPDAAWIIGRKSAAFRLAPPTRPPSTFETAKDLGSVARFDRSTIEQPDRIAFGERGAGPDARASRRGPRRYRPGTACGPCRWPRRVRRRRPCSSPWRRTGSRRRAGLRTTSSARPASRSSSVSPTQITAVMPARQAAWALARTRSLSSP